MIAPTVQETRDEADFARYIEQTVATDPEAGWIVVAENLTTHGSASVVLLVAGQCGLLADLLGTKGKSGVLRSVATRREFSMEAGYRVRFIYVPKHTSWLNQVEIWFSVLTQRLIRRGELPVEGGSAGSHPAVHRLQPDEGEAVQVDLC